MHILLLGIAIGLGTAANAQAQDYKAEITRFVIDPCYEELIYEYDSVARTGMSEEEILDAIKALAEEDIDRAMLDVFKTVKDQSVRYRMDMYRLAKEACIKGLLQ